MYVTLLDESCRICRDLTSYLRLTNQECLGNVPLINKQKRALVEMFVRNNSE